MSELPKMIEGVLEKNEDKQEFIGEVESKITSAGYEIVEKNDTKPWGAYLRIDGAQADEFVTDFFGDLTPEEARLGNPEAELSPKILIVAPHQRLSLQKHARRAERWKFLTPGAYYKSLEDDGGELKTAEAGEVVQFAQGEIHRLCGTPEGFVVVAEIWQHMDAENLSNEDDITRLADDYSR